MGSVGDSTVVSCCSHSVAAGVPGALVLDPALDCRGGGSHLCRDPHTLVPGSHRRGLRAPHLSRCPDTLPAAKMGRGEAVPAPVVVCPGVWSWADAPQHDLAAGSRHPGLYLARRLACAPRLAATGKVLVSATCSAVIVPVHPATRSPHSLPQNAPCRGPRAGAIREHATSTDQLCNGRPVQWFGRFLGEPGRAADHVLGLPAERGRLGWRNPGAHWGGDAGDRCDCGWLGARA